MHSPTIKIPLTWLMEAIRNSRFPNLAVRQKVVLHTHAMIGALLPIEHLL